MKDREEGIRRNSEEAPLDDLVKNTDTSECKEGGVKGYIRGEFISRTGRT